MTDKSGAQPSPPFMPSSNRKRPADSPGEAQNGAEPAAERLSADYAVSVGPWDPNEHARSTDDCVFLQLDPPLDRSVDAKLLDLFLQGASLRMDREEAPCLDENQIIACRIRNLPDQWDIVTPAMVRRIAADDGGQLTVGLEFVDPEQMHERLQGELSSGDNRRLRTRIQPVGPKPVLTLYTGTTGFDADIQDISVVGACVSVGPKHSASLKLGEHFGFVLSLPDGSRDIEGYCSVMWQKPDEKAFLLGLQFDIQGESHQGWAIQQLTRYIDLHLDRHLRDAG